MNSISVDISKGTRCLDNNYTNAIVMDLTQTVGQLQELNGKNISKTALLARYGH
jgi:hypothetical protein